MIEQIEELRTRALAELGRVAELKLLEEWRVTYLGKRSELNQILRGLGTLSPDSRRTVGQIANDVKRVLEEEFSAYRAQLERQAREVELAREHFDVTLPGRPLPVGQRHPISRVVQ